MSHATRRLKVQRYQVTNIDYLYFSAYRLKLQCTESANMDTRCFVYRRDPANPYTGEVTDTFFAVASPVDMAEFPPDAPDPRQAYPFFRLDTVELDLRQLELALVTEQLIVDELNVLVHALNKLEVLTPAESFWIGPFPDDTETQSLGDSLSISN